MDKDTTSNIFSDDDFDKYGHSKNADALTNPEEEPPLVPSEENDNKSLSEYEEEQAAAHYADVHHLDESIAPGTLPIQSFERLLDAFKKYDQTYNSAKYLKKLYDDYKKKGYEDSALLFEMLYWMTFQDRQRIIYERKRKKIKKADGADEETIDFEEAKNLIKVSEHISKLHTALDNQKAKKQEGLDIVTMHQNMVDLAKDQIKKNIGEFSIMCQECKTIVEGSGLPHWAVKKELDAEGHSVYYVYSPELWYLTVKKKISPHHMAFALRTSIEGLLWTRNARGAGTNPPSWDIEQEEMDLRKLMDDFTTQGEKKQLKIWEDLQKKKQQIEE